MYRNRPSIVTRVFLSFAILLGLWTFFGLCCATQDDCPAEHVCPGVPDGTASFCLGTGVAACGNGVSDDGEGCDDTFSSTSSVTGSFPSRSRVTAFLPGTMRASALNSNS